MNLSNRSAICSCTAVVAWLISGGPPAAAQSPAVRFGDIVDDPPGNVHFALGLKDAVPCLRGTHLTFQGTLVGDGITSANDTGHWMGGNSYVNLMREGNAATGVAGTTFAGFSASQLADPANLNELGHYTFVHTLAGASVTTANDTGLWAKTVSGLQLVAREGAASPVAGVTYGNFTTDNGNVVINPAGEIAFPHTLGTGATTANDTSLWHRSPAGALTLVAREGSPAAGVAGGNYSTLSGVRIDDSGEVAFQAAMTGVPAIVDTGIWMGEPGGIELIVREGDVLTATVNVGHISAGAGWSMRNTGTVAFACGLTGASVTTATDSAILTGTGSRLFVLAREGDDAPGIPPANGSHPVFGQLTAARLALTGSGWHVFNALLTGSGVGTTNDSGFWMGRSQSKLRLIAREGDRAPGFPDGVLLGHLAAKDFHANATGQFVFHATVTGPGITTSTDEVIYCTDPLGFPQRLAWEDPDADQSFSTNTSLRLLEGTSSGGDGRRSALTDDAAAGFSTAYLDIIGGGSVFSTEAVMVSTIASSSVRGIARSIADGETYNPLNLFVMDTTLALAASTDILASGTVNIGTTSSTTPAHLVLQQSSVAAGESKMDGIGELIVGTGSRFGCTDTLEAGFSAAAESFVSLSGANAVIEVGNTFELGRLGKAELRISSGGRLVADDLSLGSMTAAEAQGDGLLELSGATSTVTVTELNIGGDASGAAGFGSLIVRGGVLTAETLRLYPRGILEIAGGTVEIGSVLENNGGTILLNSGTVELPAGTVLTHSLLNALLGPERRLMNGQRLRIPGTARLEAFLTLDGGTLEADNLMNPELIRWEGGSLILADAPLTIGPAGALGSPVEVLRGQTLAVPGEERVLTVAPDGQLLIDGGRVETFSVSNAGEIRLAGLAGTLTGTSINNMSLLRGSGYLDIATVVNGPSGEIRAFPGDHLVITADAVVNNGLLDANSGIIEIASAVPVQNNTSSPGTGLITARNAMLIFDGGLTNTGAMAFSTGAVDVFGKITNAVLPGPVPVNGRITVSGGGVATFYDDVVNNSVIQVSNAGTLRSTAVFFGAFSGNGVSGGGNVFLEGDTRPGFSPGTMTFGGDVSFGPEAALKMEIGGRTPGTQYDRLTAVRSLTLNGALEVVLLGGFIPEAGDVFDVLDAASFTGAFSSMAVPSLPAGLFWRTGQLMVTGELSVAVTPDTFAAFAAYYGLPGDPAHDRDGDGADDGAEYVFGTSPVAGPATPVLRLALSGNTVRLEWDILSIPAADAVVAIESSDDLITWAELVTRTGAEDWTGPLAGRLEAKVPVAGYQTWLLSTEGGQRTFYRARAAIRK